MLAGAYANRDELLTIPLAASPAGAWAVILVSLTYMAGVRLLYRSVREGRIRARLFPVIGGPSPDPAEAFWSPVPVLAWRAWMPAKRGLLGAWGTVWRGPQLHARCAKGTHLAPAWNCACGIYGLKAPPSPQGDQVVGLVELSGKVIEHEDGYRAEHAAIKRFWLHPGARGTTHHRMLSERFGNVPIELGQPDELAAWPERQWALLEAGARMVRPGGRLVYATCSIDPRENEQVAGRLAGAFSSRTLAPDVEGCDGFFVATWSPWPE